jgi:hypothetical protein
MALIPPSPLPQIPRFEVPAGIDWSVIYGLKNVVETFWPDTERIERILTNRISHLRATGRRCAPDRAGVRMNRADSYAACLRVLQGIFADMEDEAATGRLPRRVP